MGFNTGYNHVLSELLFKMMFPPETIMRPVFELRPYSMLLIFYFSFMSLFLNLIIRMAVKKLSLLILMITSSSYDRSVNAETIEMQVRLLRRRLRKID